MTTGTLIRPGTEFGPLIGEAKGLFSDFTWLNLWTLLVRKEALEKLRLAKLKLPVAIRAALSFKSKDAPDLFELQIEPHGQLAAEFRSETKASCVVCGRNPNPVPQRIVIEASSLPADSDIFRLRDFTTVILVRDKFVEGVQSLNLQGVKFREVGIT